MNLRDRDNLRTKDKGPVPKVSFVRRLDCIQCISGIGKYSATSGLLLQPILKADHEAIASQLASTTHVHNTTYNVCTFMVAIHVVQLLYKAQW